MRTGARGCTARREGGERNGRLGSVAGFRSWRTRLYSMLSSSSSHSIRWDCEFCKALAGELTGRGEEHPHSNDVKWAYCLPFWLEMLL